MFIAHLPAGYVLTKALQKKLKTNKYLLIGLIASILPDLDILYFYLIDNRQNLHHGYWIHTPFYWLLIAATTFLTLWLAGKKQYMPAAIIFFTNIFLHLFLDTIVGKVEWLFPLTDTAYYFSDVPAVYDFWVYNFIFHWTFLFEVGVMIWAGWVLVNDDKYGIKILNFLKNFPLEIIIWLVVLIRMLYQPLCKVSEPFCYSTLPMVTYLNSSLIFELMTSATIPVVIFLFRRWIMDAWKKWGIFKRIIAAELYMYTGGLYLLTILLLLKGKGSWCLLDNCADFFGHFIFWALILFYSAFIYPLGWLILALPVIIIPIMAFIFKPRK